MTTIINKGYRPNLAIDMVTASLAHYARFNRPVENVVLHPLMWEMFKYGLLELHPEIEENIEHFNEVSFKNCNVKKGSELMVKKMYVELKELVIDESYKKKQKALAEQN